MSFSKSVSNTIGSFQHLKTFPNGFEALATNGRLKVLIYSPSVVRVTFTKEDHFEDFSYSVIQSPGESNFSLVDESDKIIIRTSALKLVIGKHPITISFFDNSGHLLNEDEYGLNTSWVGEQVTSYKKLQDGERFLGLGEKTGPLDRRGASYQNWNTDAYGYHGGSDPLYCSTPFYIGIHHQVVYGIFLDNSHKTFFNFGASNNRFSSFSADCGEMNYYFIQGNSVNQIIQNYTWLTGRMEMPPLWSIGYQQCRYSYYPDKEVLNLARTFREKEIPADVIVLDIHYMEKYKIFTWDKKNFSNPKELISHLKELGFHVVIMCDPGIKIEQGYEPYEDGVKQEVFIKYPDGKNYEGQVWPGWCHFPDFTNPKTRAWWASKFQSYVDLGLEGFWNDMNEIATWGHALPENLEFDFDGNKATTRRGRNVFGFQMARSTYEGTKALLKGKRPFNLTRSGFSGVQRYSAVWTGDNVSYDEHMLLGVRLVNSLGLTGISFAGYDAGGFVGDANTKLFARWISIASLSPFFRAHTMINTRDSEPWSYGEEVEQIARNYISLRYQLLPYIYSLFYHSSQTGEPIQRSLAIDYTFTAEVYNHLYHNQYLLGPSIMVAPVESNRELLKVFLPEGDWYYLFTGKKHRGGQEIIIETPIHKLPVFIKGGAILPMQRTTPNTKVKSDELILHVYKGGDSQFQIYEDDGETFDYQNGNFTKRTISYEPNQQKLILGKSEGTYPTSYKKLKLMLHGFSEDEIMVTGHKRILIPQLNSFFTPLEKYDPINDPDSFGEEELRVMEMEYSTDEIIFTW
jgi:alpha-glucosidase